MRQWLDRLLPHRGRQQADGRPWLYIGPQQICWGGWDAARTVESGRSAPSGTHALAEPPGPSASTADWLRLLDALAIDALPTAGQPNGKYSKYSKYSKARHKAAHITIYVADTWCRWWVLPRPAGLHQLQDLQALAETRLCAAYGLVPGAWAVALDRPRWQALRQASAHWTCCALPRPLLAALQAWAAQRGLQLCSVQPASAHLLEGWLAGGSTRDTSPRWLACEQPGLTLLLLAEGLWLRAISPLWHAAPTGTTVDDSTLASHAARLALAQGCEPCSALPRITLAAPDAWPARTGGINFLNAAVSGEAPAAPPWRGLGRSLAFTGAALLASALLSAPLLMPATDDSAVTSGVASERPSEQLATSAASPEAMAASADRWDSVFASLELSLPADVALMSLELRADNRFKLQAASPRQQAGADWLQQLAGQPSIAELRLLQLEPRAVAPSPGTPQDAPAPADEWLITLEGRGQRPASR